MPIAKISDNDDPFSDLDRLKNLAMPIAPAIPIALAMSIAAAIPIACEPETQNDEFGINGINVELMLELMELTLILTLIPH